MLFVRETAVMLACITWNCRKTSISPERCQGGVNSGLNFRVDYHKVADVGTLS